MSPGLLEQLADYGAHHDEVQGRIDAADIAESTRRAAIPATTVVRRRRSTPLGLLTAAAVSVAVLTLIGGAVLLTRWSLDGQPPVTDPATTIATPSTTLAPPTTSPAPSTTVPGTDFAPRLEGSGVDVTFDVTPVEMEIAGNSFVVLEANWFVDWDGMVWEWGDDEIRQALAAGNRGNQVKWQAETRTLVVQHNADKPTGEDLIARFTVTYSGNSDDFEIQARDETSGEVLASVSGSLPGLEEDQILQRVARGPTETGWFFASDNGELTPLDPPWEPFWVNLNEFFEIGDSTLAVFATGYGGDPGWNVWRTTDGYAWEDLGPPSWPDLGHPFVLEDRMYEHGWTVDARGHLDELQFWSSPDGVEWVELTQAEYETATGLTVSTDNPEDLPPPPDRGPGEPATTPELLPAVLSYFEEISQDGIVISEDPLIVQLRPGPAPRFDTSGLGEEIPFEPLDPDDPRALWLVDHLAQGDGEPPLVGPVLFIGHVTDTVMALPYDDQNRRVGWNLLIANDCGETGCRGFDAVKASESTRESRRGSEDIPYADMGNGEGHVFVVPLDTSVVVVRYNGDTALWQRPTGGWAIFPYSVDGDETFWVDLYDADGNLMMTTEKR